MNYSAEFYVEFTWRLR